MQLTIHTRTRTRTPHPLQSTMHLRAAARAPAGAGMAWPSTFAAAARLVAVLLCVASGTLAESGNNKEAQPAYEPNRYDARFFADHRQWEGVYPALAEILSEVAGRVTGAGGGRPSLLDVGCGHGLLVEAWRAAGFTQSYGLEGSPAAKGMWPQDKADEYYAIEDLTSANGASSVVPTDIVTTFEVAEHLPAEHAARFVSLLTTHKPELVVFGAATPGQAPDLVRAGELGLPGPSHPNEETFAYWIALFQEQGYVLDAASSAKIKHKLVFSEKFRPFMDKAWWYPKNVLVFSPATHQTQLDQSLVEHPAKADMLSEEYLKIADGSYLQKLWRKDWTSFGTLFYAEQNRARARMGLPLIPARGAGKKKRKRGKKKKTLKPGKKKKKKRRMKGKKAKPPGRKKRTRRTQGNKRQRRNRATDEL